MPAAKWSVEIQGIASVRQAFAALGELDTPFYLAALNESGHVAVGEVNAHARGGIAGKAYLSKITGTGLRASAIIKVKHPASRPTEFGRHWFYRGFTRGGKGSQKRTGTRFYAAPGRAPNVYVGILAGGHAVGAAAPRIQKIMTDAIEREFALVAAKGQSQ